ncbi:MAG: hypothetical protein JRM86_05600 [Nitrososphaerota archaeon]|nr:hypothetical protein [Nitrososphaerota archaeon]
MSILVLGPSKWKEGYAPAKVPRVDPADLEGMAGPPPNLSSPLAVRGWLVRFLREVEGVRATMMELHAPKPGETHTALFNRLCHEARVDGFFVFWPYGAQRSGLDVELGFLLWQFEHGRSPDVRIFAETGEHRAAKVVDGHLVVLEQGSRTRYYEDLVQYGAAIAEWSDYSELLESIYHHAHDWLNET